MSSGFQDSYDVITDRGGEVLNPITLERLKIRDSRNIWG